MLTESDCAASAAPSSAETFSLVPAAAQRQMYSAMVQLSKQDGPRSGTEIAEIAAALALREADPVITADCARGAHMVRNNLVEFACKAAQVTPSRWDIATGLAVSALTGEHDRTALICCGCISENENYRDALRFAGDHKLPIIYLAGNQYTAGKPKHDFRTLYAEFGVPVFTVDASDAIAVFRVVTEALHNARFGRGASLLDVLQVSSSKKRLASREPLELLEGYMRRHGTWDEELRG